MKTLVNLSLAAILALSFSACAPSTKSQAVRIKCPKCGYEFDWSDDTIDYDQQRHDFMKKK